MQEGPKALKNLDPCGTSSRGSRGSKEQSKEGRISTVIKQRHLRSNKEQFNKIEKMAILLPKALAAVERLTEEIQELIAEVQDLKRDVAYHSEVNVRMEQSLAKSDVLEEDVRHAGELSDELAKELLDGLTRLSQEFSDDAKVVHSSSASATLQPKEDTGGKSVG